MVDVVIIGGGLAGLSCARVLQERGLSFVLLEAEEAVGGRVRTDEADGFRMDRGFQVLLSAYPEARRQLDYAKLDLKAFTPGAMLWHGGRFHRMADPFREPRYLVHAALDNTLTLKDKLLVARLRGQVLGMSPRQIFRGEQEDTRTWLKQYGFSERAITHFFQPFFGGVFLDNSLRASSRFFRFLFQCFSSADTVVPALGMEQIPLQMASGLPPQRVLTSTPVKRIERLGNGRFAVETAQQHTVDARNVVLATDGDTARSLATPVVGARQVPSVGWNQTSTIYFAARRAEIEEPVLLLNGEGPNSGPVNHACFISQVSPALARSDSALFCANVVGHAPREENDRAALAADVQAHLRRWFGRVVDTWQIVGGYFLEHAVPLQRYAEWEQGTTRVRVGSSGRKSRDSAVELFLCGDYCELASIQGALTSGRRTAQALLESLD